MKITLAAYGYRMSLALAGAIAPLMLAGAAYAGMATGGLTSQPIGHYDFCKRYPAECAIRSADRGPETMTGTKWKAITRVNASVNNAVKPMSDLEIYGKDEYWAYPDQVGDCEDYVLLKRKLLARQGISISNLLITVVRKADGEGHAVLTVRTDKGDFILDNLADKVKQWNETPYRFLKRQSSEHTGRWVTIRGDASPLVGSVK
ncbi:MAG: transglutaminase-like cysteine peptidase [Mesorhizobium sp.]